MAKKDKDLLLQDVCARLPYHLKGKSIDGKLYEAVVIYDTGTILATEVDGVNTRISCGFKPYLRPLSSMTEEEKEELESISSFYFNDALDAQIQESLKDENKDGSRMLEYVACTKVTDWLLEHHFDIHGLIEKGLAIEATEEIYNFKK